MKEKSNCPLCKSNDISIFLNCEDYFLSKEQFNIVQCNNCSFKFTNPWPNDDKLGKYYKSEEYISHSNNKKGLSNIIYQKVRKYTIKKKYRQITSFVKKGEILDIGCATGHLLSYFKDNGWKTTGIETDENSRNFAIKSNNLDVYNEEKLNELANRSYSVISMYHVLEHVPDIYQRMENVTRILKDDGFLFVALPNHKAWDAKHYQNYWAAWDVPRHLHHFNQKNVQQVIEKFNLELVKVFPMKFDAFYVALLSEKYKNGKKSFPKALNVGMKSNRWARRNNNDYSSLLYVMKKK